METLAELQPELVFKYFDEICKIPRASGKEEKIISYLVQFALENGLEHKKDKVGNVLIMKKASEGMENRIPVVLQSHVDMVAEKNGDTVHDFDKDPIPVYVENGWVKARGTTLGADCGIGMAAALAVLADKSLKHGALECLFTVDEERGLKGAKNITKGFFTGKTLVNLDSEDEGELFIGCAGGVNTFIRFTYKMESTPSDYVGYKVFMTGLLGGHSGDDINRGRANAIKVLNRFLWRTSRRFDFRISNYDGGNLINVIPREAYATLAIHKDLKQKLIDRFEIFKEHIEDEFGKVETNVDIELLEVKTPEYVIDELTQFEFLAALHACPSGVLRMSDELEGVVETSTNIASVKFINNEIVISTGQRSSIKSKKQYAVDMLTSLFSLTNARVSVSEGYPEWQPNVNSKILHVTKSVYEKLFGKQPAVKVIHAGLECGLFLKEYPDLDMISIGPTVRDAHSPNERLEIVSVGKFWELLKGILENAPVATG
ncbi:MAG: aminoacyl-histidine dipeptidase [Prevotellaceae bacterium]|jgi:dipeptidase D|nr:aminoacyl-histidine dipeptidase [Prevotellaceae bacterium]